MTWNHLGFVFEPSPTTISCDTEDIWYAGGEGDFDVFLDSKKEYFYFFFTNYSSIPVEQGLCVGRMKYADRNDPRGKVSVWHEGEWNESALGGHAKTRVEKRVSARLARVPTPRGRQQFMIQ